MYRSLEMEEGTPGRRARTIATCCSSSRQRQRGRPCERRGLLERASPHPEQTSWWQEEGAPGSVRGGGRGGGKIQAREWDELALFLGH
ncbi:hypothetical protein NFJ02_37g93190 [Pycnococcus provasolii]